MSAEPRRVTKAEVWAAWENQVVNGIFPLRRFLGGSHNTAVFLTEHHAKNLANVAIKFVLADESRAEAQLAQWARAATISHPHVMRIFDVGRCELGGRGFLFVVMEYADQTLAQILPRRALTPDEVRELLPPTLDALGFLHRNQLVHGQLRPSNLLVVNDQLKLSSDNFRPIGESTSHLVRTSLYDPPELSESNVSSAGDIWALGMTLVDALTQRTSAWSAERGEAASLLTSLPAPFAETVRRCLSRTPANRPTIAELEAQYSPTAQPHGAARAPASEAADPDPLANEVIREPIAPQPLATEVPGGVSVPQPPASVALRAPAAPEPPAVQVAREPSAAQPSASKAPHEATPPQSGGGISLWVLAIAGALLIFLAGWFALRSPRLTPAAAPSVAKVAESGSVESALTLSSDDAQPPDQPPVTPAATSLKVLHEVTPEISQTIRNGIRGHIKVTVRVLVDSSGSVAGDLLERPGSSRYFARRAREAAAQWKFAPTDDGSNSRVWLLHFDFSRSGVTAQATAVQ